VDKKLGRMQLWMGLRETYLEESSDTLLLDCSPEAVGHATVHDGLA